MKKKQPPPNSDTDLSRYWYCPRDRSKLQALTTRYTHTPYFNVSRQNREIGIHNAISLQKIPPGEESEKQVEELVDYIFQNDPEIDEITLVAVKCPKCEGRFAAPKLARITELDGISTGHALYMSQSALETKNYGRFRFVDHFGLQRQQDQGSGMTQRSGIRNLWLIGWILGIQYMILVFFLYYVIGFEMKVGNRFIPLGPILLSGGLLLLLAILIWANLLNPLAELIKPFIPYFFLQ